MAAVPQAVAPAFPPHANVYIRNISPLADEGTIQALFEPYGAIITMKLVRNKIPGGRSYAFVNYQSIESAHNAIVSLNGFQFDDGVIEVKSANSDAQFDKPTAQPDVILPNDNLYVTNLPPHFTDELLVQLFQSFGTVISCKLLNRADNPVPGFNAMVRMASVDEATQAMQRLQNVTLPGSSMPAAIKYADTPEQKAMRKSRTASKHLAGARFQPYEPTASRQPPFSHNPPPGPQAGFNPPPAGYNMPLQEISFNQPQTNGIPPLPSYPGVSLDPNAPPPNYDPSSIPPGMALVPASASIYIKNLPEKADKLYLYETFAPLGAIRSVKVMANEGTGLCTGVGFVNFVEGSDAHKAVQHFNGASVEGKMLYVAVQPFKPPKAKGLPGQGGPPPGHYPPPYVM